MHLLFSNFTQIYETRKAAKGKVLILSLPKFEVDAGWLCSLPAYREDCRRMTDILTKIGFEVLVPQFPPGLDDYCLTAKVRNNSFLRLSQIIRITIVGLKIHGNNIIFKTIVK